jgi:hypothetical protein
MHEASVQLLFQLQEHPHSCCLVQTILQMTLLCKVQVQVQAILQERMCCSAESVCGNF